MPSSPPGGLPGLPSFVLLALTAIAGAGYTLRLLRRRERQHARREVWDLGGSLREFLARRLPAQALAAQADAADTGAFWTAVEELTSRGKGWLALSRALAPCRHLETERAALRDESPWRRELAARRLGLLVSLRSRSALRAALHEGPELVTVAAAYALARYRDLEALRWLLDNPEAVLHRTPRTRVALLRAFGRRAVPVLAEALAAGSGDAAMQRALIETLGLADCRDARILIARHLREGEVEIRVAAARALGRLRADDCATSLMGALQDEAWQVRAQAAWALGRTGAELALLVLPARLTDPAWWVRRHAAYALLEFGPEGRHELEAIAHGSPDPYARDMASEALESRSAAA
jgi:HEAT repeat protein